MPFPSAPTVAELAQAPGASFTFNCRPCGRHKFYFGEELERFLARVPDGETFESLKGRMVCPKCGMPVDGVFRTFEANGREFISHIHAEPTPAND